VLPKRVSISAAEATVARPSKLTQSVQRTICEALREGASLVDACSKAGVGTSTVLEWLARGRGEDARRPSLPVYAHFAQAVEAIRSNSPDEKPTFAELAEPAFSDARAQNARAREDEPRVRTGPFPNVRRRATGEESVFADAQEYDF
jgi:hypothetical protein